MTVDPSLEPSHTGISTPLPTKPCIIPHTFRIGQPSDAMAISDLLIEVFTQTFSHDLPPDDLDEYLKNTLSPQQIENDIRDPNSIWILTSSLEDELLGIIQLRTNSIKECLALTANPIELHRIYLSTRTHGKGLSQAILQHAEGLAREREYRSIWLGVYSKHPQGIRFYEKMGFKRCGERIFVVGAERQVDWVMEKSL
ncbi:hypothetical protein I302_100793 [Kwoniella bestiolae CBS 10118]|uniref:N-acetyltransferase domain-containing protein n=1 Tax=Kwoniella bestiolae CBS 10118 TaxID=1296100 RepID=A0A1B9G652_9TREE|nr:hypothetical protein I302_04166 [Kwoniella bestiolae CBS 10118]OCF26480.1 hypothetical protein I302_04166 [Kwoniella bestiolae CBS 10118]